jgi:fermentation-respiration switch protein FrsA (DUF1100 family)
MATVLAWVVFGGVVVFVVAVVVIVVIAAYSAHTVVRPRRDWRPPEWQPPELPVEAVSFQNPAGQALGAWFLPPPAHVASAPVALICHGFGTNRREGQDLLPWLHTAGYGALLLDFQAHGESAGRYTTVGLREVDDFLAAVRYLRDRLGDAPPIVAIGFSMGASVAIMGAARCPDIRAVVADSPFATLSRAVARSFRIFFRLPPRLFAPPTVWFAEWMAGARVGTVRPIDAVAALAPRPLFIIQGLDDPIVDPDDALLLYAAAGEPKTLWRLEGCGHVQARSLCQDEYRARVLGFLETALQGPPAREVHDAHVAGGHQRDGAAGAQQELDRRPHAVDGELLVADDLRVR